MLESTPGEHTKPEAGARHLRVLIANEKRERLELLAQVVIGLGHDVIAREIDIDDVGPVTAREHPDVALVGLGESSDHALALITEIVQDASWPVISILHAGDSAFVREAAKRGVFAYIVDGVGSRPDELQSAIDITLQRFREYQNLQGAFGRRAQIEQAKAVLMARHALTADQAFDRLRGHSQRHGRKLADVAAAVVESHLLLLPPTPQIAPSCSPPPMSRPARKAHDACTDPAGPPEIRRYRPRVERRRRSCDARLRPDCVRRRTPQRALLTSVA